MCRVAAGAVLEGGWPSGRTLQQAVPWPSSLNTSTLLCPEGASISAIRGLADLQLHALQIACRPGSNSNCTDSWGSWNLLEPQPLSTALWAISDPHNLVPPLIFWFTCDGGFDALRQTPSGSGITSHPVPPVFMPSACTCLLCWMLTELHSQCICCRTHTGTSGAVSTLAWHCASTGQWTYPNVARASLSPPTAVSNCTALINSTGLHGQQQRMVGISLEWQPAADGAVSSGTVMFVVHVA
jgi:hypothetical protein